jgi:hypothetical protein
LELPDVPLVPMVPLVPDAFAPVATA